MELPYIQDIAGNKKETPIVLLQNTDHVIPHSVLPKCLIHFTSFITCNGREEEHFIQ